ncbi:MAG TPA: NAD-dependent epimerase/dehydratase family protein [Verrucomicrobiae bacterium]|nr:NAD-dependent epimerase/dehydratase family protein [Verrucomicrobiae bacterium]
MSSDTKMKVLVTGGTGFTGSHLVRRLLDRGHEVRVVDNQPGLFCDELKKRGAKIDLGSVTDAGLMKKSVAGCELVYHIAAAFRQLNVPDRHYWEVNVEGTRRLADAAFNARVRRFVYCSTQGVHGHIKNPPGDENSPIEPEDYYQLTKYEGEKVVQEYIARGLDAVTLRPTAIYGPGDPERFLILFRLAKRGSFLMFGDGETFYHPVYIDNLVDAFELAGAKAGISGESYIIGDEHYYSLKELVSKVGAAMEIPVRIRYLPFWPLWTAALVCESICKPLRITPPLFRRRVDWFRQVRAFSIDKAKRHLGYQPQVDLPTGLSRTAKWYAENSYV